MKTSITLFTFRSVLTLAELTRRIKKRYIGKNIYFGFCKLIGALPVINVQENVLEVVFFPWGRASFWHQPTKFVGDIEKDTQKSQLTLWGAFTEPSRDPIPMAFTILIVMVFAGVSIMYTALPQGLFIILIGIATFVSTSLHEHFTRKYVISYLKLLLDSDNIEMQEV